MTSAFVDAFAGPDGSTGFSNEKVAAVLAGRAKLQLVQVAQPPPYVAGTGTDVEGLGNSLGGLSIATTTTTATAPVTTQTCGFDNVCKRWMGTSKKTEDF